MTGIHASKGISERDVACKGQKAGKEKTSLAIYHCSIKIIGRSGGRSAVASSAYRSGEKLYNEETGITHDFTRKHGVIFSEVILPENVPRAYSDREILWNEVQKIEKRSDAQLAREVEVALPAEMTREQQIECVRSYVKENFTSRGMIADWALHDKEDGNPHAHVMLSVRGMDENEKWLSKQKSVYANARDDQGRPIYNPDLPSYDAGDKENTARYRIPVLDKDGNQKTRVREGKGTEYLWERISVPANDWNDRARAEEWRRSWAECCNRYLPQEARIDHRSYKRQGIELEPTIHEGVAARQMEKRGITSDRCQTNREIREWNAVLKKIRQTANEITAYIMEKARGIIGRLEKLRGSDRGIERTGRDAWPFGDPAGRDRNADQGERGPEGEAGRIHAIMRDADRSAEEIEERHAETVGTDHEIEGTEQRINELKELKARKEMERDERIRRLKQRQNGRAADAAGGAGGRARQADGGEREAQAAREREPEMETKGIRAYLRDYMDQKRRESEAGTGTVREQKPGSVTQGTAPDIGRTRREDQGVERPNKEYRGPSLGL